MCRIELWETDPEIQTALADFKRLISERYPEATFTVEIGGEPEGVYLIATTNSDDMFEVLEVIRDRLFEVQVEEFLPVYVIPMRPAPPRPAPAVATAG
jgi:hypothetical protein